MKGSASLSVDWESYFARNISELQRATSGLEGHKGYFPASNSSFNALQNGQFRSPFSMIENKDRTFDEAKEKRENSPPILCLIFNVQLPRKKAKLAKFATPLQFRISATLKTTPASNYRETGQSFTCGYHQ